MVCVEEFDVKRTLAPVATEVAHRAVEEDFHRLAVELRDGVLCPVCREIAKTVIRSVIDGEARIGAGNDRAMTAEDRGWIWQEKLDILIRKLVEGFRVC